LTFSDVRHQKKNYIKITKNEFKQSISVKAADAEFVPCVKCFNEYLNSHTSKWEAAVKKGKLPAPMHQVASEIGNTCRKSCGKMMPTNEELAKICKNLFFILTLSCYYFNFLFFSVKANMKKQGSS
jgi:hypothetical protein